MPSLLNWRTWLYGFLSWLLPFVASFLFFDQSGSLSLPQPLFKSLMVLIGGAAGTVLLVLTFRQGAPSIATGLAVGLLWLGINLVLDVIVLVPMMKTTVVSYLYDIGLRYFLLPIIAAAMGAVAQRAG